jgi:hypothetical protein
LTLILAVLVGTGGLVWYPTSEARLPVAALLALLSGGIVAWPWPRARWNKIAVMGLMLAVALLACWPRPAGPAALLSLRDRRERALASAGLGNFDEAIQELTGPDRDATLTLLDHDLVASWRFSVLLKNLPALPPSVGLEQQLLENADLAAESPAAQFRSGTCLWLLGRGDGALYFWENLANADSDWGAAARTALALSGRETPAQAQRRAAWEIGGGPRPNPALAPFFAKLHKDRADDNSVAH